MPYGVTLRWIDGLPKARGFDVILLVVDRLSKYAHFFDLVNTLIFFTLKHPYTAKSVAEVFVKEVVRFHGFPKSIVSHCDKVFVRNFWCERFRLFGA